jgi:hypothetical protein
MPTLKLVGTYQTSNEFLGSHHSRNTFNSNLGKLLSYFVFY